MSRYFVDSYGNPCADDNAEEEKDRRDETTQKNETDAAGSIQKNKEMCAEPGQEGDPAGTAFLPEAGNVRTEPLRKDGEETGKSSGTAGKDPGPVDGKAAWKTENTEQKISGSREKRAEEETAGTAERKEGRLRMRLIAAAVALLCAAVLRNVWKENGKHAALPDGREVENLTLADGSDRIFQDQKETESNLTEAENDSSVSEGGFTGIMKEPETEETEPKETMTEDTEPEAVSESEENWEDQIFGKVSPAVIPSSVTVRGLTENEKELLGFRESDFVRSLSSFLNANRVNGRTVTFTGSVPAYCGSGAAYEGELNGAEGKGLITIFYPEFPGRYLFILTQRETEKQEAIRETNPPQDVVTAAQTESPPVILAPPVQTEPAYDASRLLITGMDGELVNYMANPLQLQYGLYDFLYSQGYQDVRRAEVGTYTIDPENRTATIEITAAGAGSVTAVYDRDRNTFVFR